MTARKWAECGWCKNRLPSYVDEDNNEVVVLQEIKSLPILCLVETREEAPVMICDPCIEFYEVMGKRLW